MENWPSMSVLGAWGALGVERVPANGGEIGCTRGAGGVRTHGSHLWTPSVVSFEVGIGGVNDVEARVSGVCQVVAGRIEGWGMLLACRNIGPGLD